MVSRKLIVITQNKQYCRVTLKELTHFNRTVAQCMITSLPNDKRFSFKMHRILLKTWFVSQPSSLQFLHRKNKVAQNCSQCMQTS